MRSTSNVLWVLLILAMVLGIVAQLLDARDEGWTGLGIVYMVGASTVFVVSLVAIIRDLGRRRRQRPAQESPSDP